MWVCAGKRGSNSKYRPPSAGGGGAQQRSCQPVEQSGSLIGYWLG